MSLISGTSPTSGTDGELDPADRLVRGVVHVRRVLAESPVGPVRHVRERAVLGGRGHVDLGPAQPARGGDRLLGPLAGVHVVHHRLPAQQVQRDHLELQRRPTLQEQHVVAVRHPEQAPQVGLGPLGDLGELLAPMAHLGHRLAGAVPVEHLVGRPLQHALGQHGRPGTEVEDLPHAALLLLGVGVTTTTRSPPSTCWTEPSASRCTVPAMGVVMAASIFIASMVATV